MRQLQDLVFTSALVLVSAITLTSCSSTVSMNAAPDATARACADVTVRLPDAVAGLPKRETDAQGTGAWGSPTAVLLRCGVPTPGPTTARCVSVDGVDWIIDESAAPRYLFTTFGRTPAVEVVVDNSKVSGTTAVSDISASVAVIPPERECTSL